MATTLNMEFNTNHSSDILHNLNRKRTSTKEFCDFVIKAGREKFAVHKCVVGSLSEYFKTMLTTQMREAYSNEATVQLSSSIMTSILDFIYTSCINISMDTVYEVLEAAEYLQIKDLKDCCGTVFNKHLSGENCLKIRKYARLYNLQNVATRADSIISESLASSLMSEDILDLDIGDVKALLQMESQQQSIHEVKYKSLVKWVTYDMEVRQQHFNDLFSFLNLQYLSKRFLQTVVLKEKVIMESAECTSLLLNALIVHVPTQPEDPLLPTPVQLRQQATNKRILVIGGEDVSRNVATYNVASKQFTDMPKTINARKDASVVNYYQCVYLMGGRGSVNAVRSAEILDLSAPEPKWKIKNLFIPQNRSLSCASVLCNDMIYCVGGYDMFVHAFLTCYDPKDGKWIEKKRMQEARGRHALVVSAHERIFAIGGKTNDAEATNTAECYDPISQDWTSIPPMKTPRVGLCAAVLDDQIYAIGGHSGSGDLSSVEKFDLVSEEWSDVASMKEKRFGAAACAIKDRIYVFGGWNAKTVEVYYPRRNEWKKEAKMDLQRPFPSVVVI